MSNDVNIYDLKALRAYNKSVKNASDINAFVTAGMVKGIATQDGSPTVLIDITKNLVANALTDKEIAIIVDGVEYRRTIISNTDSEFTFGALVAHTGASVTIGTGVETEGQFTLNCIGDMAGAIGNTYSFQVLETERTLGEVNFELDEVNKIFKVLVDKTGSGTSQSLAIGSLETALLASNYADSFEIEAGWTSGSVAFMAEALPFVGGEDGVVASEGCEYVIELGLAVDSKARADVADVADELDELKSDYVQQIEEIKTVIGINTIEINSWKTVQEIVRQGRASEYFKVGDQFVANYNSSPVVWNVIGIDHDIPTDVTKTHSLTIQAHDCITNCQFDAPELLYFAEAELAAGSYYFYNSYDTKNYAFTTTIAIPVGGSIEVSTWGASENPTQVKTYNATNTLLETLAVTEAATGTLITCNDLRRVRYGSNNYIESNIKQWLNSSETTFTWAKKSKYSKPSSDAPYSGGGFLKLLDQELAAVLGAVDKQVAKNTVTDGGGQDLFSDKVFLLSRVEVYGGNEGVVTGEQAYPWYSSLATNPTSDVLAGRIKYLSGAARSWWLRSPYVGYSHGSRAVNASGNVGSDGAVHAYGLAPACCIV